MIDLYLKGNSEEELKELLPWMVNEDRAWIVSDHKWALDPVGDIFKITSYTDKLGELVLSQHKIDGWHANLRLLDDTLESLVPDGVRVIVNSPSRVWA